MSLVKQRRPCTTPLGIHMTISENHALEQFLVTECKHNDEIDRQIIAVVLSRIKAK